MYTRAHARTPAHVHSGGRAAAIGRRVGAMCSKGAEWMLKETATAAGMGSNLNAPAYRPISTYRQGRGRCINLGLAQPWRVIWHHLSCCFLCTLSLKRHIKCQNVSCVLITFHVPLEPKAFVTLLRSGGMRRRLSVACALVGKPGGKTWSSCVQAREAEGEGDQVGRVQTQREHLMPRHMRCSTCCFVKKRAYDFS